MKPRLLLAASLALSALIGGSVIADTTASADVPQWASGAPVVMTGTCGLGQPRNVMHSVGFDPTPDGLRSGAVHLVVFEASANGCDVMPFPVRWNLGPHTELAIDEAHPTECVLVDLNALQAKTFVGCLDLAPAPDGGLIPQLVDQSGKMIGLPLPDGYLWELAVPVRTTLPDGGLERLSMQLGEPTMSPSVTTSWVDVPVLPATSNPGPPQPAGTGSYTPVVPERLLETRPAGQTGYSGPRPAAGATIELQITGRAGVPTDATAAVLNVTGTNATGGYVTVWPCGTPRPNASNLNLPPAGTSPNLVITKIGTNGKVCLYTQNPTDLIADINGWYPAGSTYTPVVPERLLETRPAGQTGYSGPRPAAGATIELQITGRAGVPTDATAAVLNVTGTNATGGYVTVWPCGTPRPNASNLNLPPAGTSPNLVITKIGTNGKVCLYTQNPTDLIADINGWYPAP